MTGIKSGGRKVQSVETLFSILELLKDQNGAGVTEIAQELDMAKSSVHRYLHTLVESGYAVKEGNEYHLGLQFIGFGTFVRHRKKVQNLAKPKSKQLAEETGERAQFIMEENGRGVYIHRETGENAVETDASIGKTVHLQTTAAGKAILASLPCERVDEIIDRWGFLRRTEHTIMNKEELHQTLNEIQKRGYAFNREEHVEGLWGVAAPVHGPDNEVLGALSVSGPANRIRERISNEEIPSMILGATNELSLNLKYS